MKTANRKKQPKGIFESLGVKSYRCPSLILTFVCSHIYMVNRQIQGANIYSD